jgi:hypothetical protein
MKDVKDAAALLSGAEGEREMKPRRPTDPALDIRLRTLLSSWKSSRGFRTARARHFRRRLVPHASQTELNREFESRSQATLGWSAVALLAFAAIDYFYLRSTAGL